MSKFKLFVRALERGRKTSVPCHKTQNNCQIVPLTKKRPESNVVGVLCEVRAYCPL